MTGTVDTYPRAAWGEYPLPGENPIFWPFGPLALWCKNFANEIWIARQASSPENAADRSALPDDRAWSRWALQHSYTNIHFLPVFPDRPVVVKPEVPFHLMRNGGKATVYIRIPLWIHIALVRGSDRSALLEMPIVTLSDTWFGSYLGGDLCYWISSGARRNLDPETPRPHLATCTVHIKNHSEEDLHVDKICLIVSHLSLFELEGRLYSDEVTIDFKGAQEIGGFSVSGKSPFPDATLISSPRTPTKPDFSARSLLSFMN